MPDTEVTIYWLSQLDGDFAGRLAPDEAARAARLRRAADRRLFIAAHALLRFALAQHGCGDRPLVISSAGKPMPAAGTPQFSLSHCDGMALCAIGGRRQLGIDVEPFGQGDDGVARLVFNQQERDWIAGDDERFFRLWTMKEALFKAADAVWDDGWRHFSALPALRDGRQPDHHVEQRRLGARHVAALAVRGGAAATVAWRAVTAAELCGGRVKDPKISA